MMIGGRRPPPSLRARALACLSRREYSRAELKRKLAPHAESEEALDALLDALVAERWLSDARFVDSLLHRRAARFGTARIVDELKSHAVDTDTLAEVRDTLRESEEDRARAVWASRFGRPPADEREYARQVRFLMSRGFPAALVRKIVGRISC